MPYHYSGLGPPGFGRQPELLPIILDVLRGSNVGPGVRAIIYTDTKKNKDLVDSFYQASLLLGAETAVLYTGPREDDRTPLPIALHALRGADIILDLASALWIYTDALSEMLDEGKRILSCVSDIDTCIKLKPDSKIVSRVNHGGALIDQAETIQVRTSGGTDMTYDKRGRQGVFQDGLTPNPGDWDNYPAYQVACAPLEDSASGQLVVSPGDLFVTLKRVAAERTVLTIEGGCIVKIDGQSEAEMLRLWWKDWNDPTVYTTSHVGFGCDPRSQVNSNQLMEWETLAGGSLLAFGSNILRFLGGQNRSPAHLDITLRNVDFILDGELIIDKGQFVHPDLV